ncbi:MAG: preprotein translocase subunit SecA, partial [Candidatus Desantisbacteria bacterium]
MLDSLLKKLFGTKHDRDVHRLQPIAEEVNSFEPQISVLSDEELRLKTDEFKKRLADGETLEDILTEAFAVVREAGKRVVNMRHFDVQIMGGIALHEGNIAEMKTGEGKTLVATLAVYLNALTGKGVHVVTINDYLAKRDKNWMGPIYEFLGLTVGAIQHNMTPPQRQQAYACDVTYGT